MNRMGERWQTAKPYLWGFVVGLIAAPIFGFWHGDVVTAGTRDRDVQAARIDAQAAICEQLARAYWVETGDTTGLTGYTGRDARNELAARFAVMPGQDEADRAVQRACADKLAAAAV